MRPKLTRSSAHLVGLNYAARCLVMQRRVFERRYVLILCPLYLENGFVGARRDVRV